MLCVQVSKLSYSEERLTWFYDVYAPFLAGNISDNPECNIDPVRVQIGNEIIMSSTSNDPRRILSVG